MAKYLGEAIRDMNEKTTKKQHMAGIKQWITDYQTMVKAGNVKGAKTGKISIEKAMKEAGLSDKEKKSLWESLNESAEELNESAKTTFNDIENSVNTILSTLSDAKHMKMDLSGSESVLKKIYKKMNSVAIDLDDWQRQSRGFKERYQK